MALEEAVMIKERETLLETEAKETLSCSGMMFINTIPYINKESIKYA